MRSFFALVTTTLVCIGLGIAALLAFGDASLGEPVYAAVPHIPPPMRLVSTGGGRAPSGSACVQEHSIRLGGRDSGPVTVSPSPLSITAVWVPGLNSHRCHTTITRGDEEAAQRLAIGLDEGPEVSPNVAYMCPDSDGSEAELYFSYGKDRPSEIAVVELSGCLFVSDPGRSSRWWSKANVGSSSLEAALAQLAPPRWRASLHRDA